MSTHEQFLHLFDSVKDSELYEVEKLKIKFANDLHSIMEQLDVSNTEFAEKIGSSSSYVTKVLRGDANFTIATMVKLANAVQCRVSFELRSEKYPKIEDVTELVRSFVQKSACVDISTEEEGGHDIQSNIWGEQFTHSTIIEVKSSITAPRERYYAQA